MRARVGRRMSTGAHPARRAAPQVSGITAEQPAANTTRRLIVLAAATALFPSFIDKRTRPHTRERCTLALPLSPRQPLPLSLAATYKVLNVTQLFSF